MASCSAAVSGRSFALPGKFKAAVFDFDGLLVDSEPGWSRAEALLVTRHGGTYTDEDRQAGVGRSIDQSVIEYAQRLGFAIDATSTLREELSELARAEYLAGLALRPGAAELVAGLRRHMRLGLASNSDRSLVQLGLQLSTFDGSFDLVVTRDDVENPKPAPDIYALACRRLGVRPDHAVAFEDSVTGVAAAKEAGLTVVAVGQLPGAVTGADLVVQSLTDLVVG